MEKLKETEFIPVGKKVEVGLKTFKVMEGDYSFSCEKCCLFNSDLCPILRNYFLGDCSAILREDNKEVYFVECK